ncbi:hypothetical protein BT96DRAFT_1007496 [Gymnopus androsaceus JB14]|uniref:Uncharacterized protein n=1 Tax=Gymnopus androsaceus JB14 TaxID=1447944 RepID=A0A6A4GHM9_9AGAR|nr:hypothetical protein BT96DRAFT_1007496 [Gymnopus androsaceus JB14]
MDSFKKACTDALKEKHFLHLPPGASGLVDFKLLLDDHNNLLLVDKQTLEEHRASTDFRFPSCLHSYLTGVYSETTICYRGSVLAFGCAQWKKEWCGYFILVRSLLGVGSQVQSQRYQPTYLGTALFHVSTFLWFLHLQRILHQPHHSFSAEMAAAQLSPSASSSDGMLPMSTPPHRGITGSNPMSPGMSNLSCGKKRRFDELEDSDKSPLLSLVDCMRAAVQQEAESSQTVEEPSPTKPTSATQPVCCTYREIALRESMSTSSLLPKQVFTAFCVTCFPKATYNERLSGGRHSAMTGRSKSSGNGCVLQALMQKSLACFSKGVHFVNATLLTNTKTPMSSTASLY